MASFSDMEGVHTLTCNMTAKSMAYMTPKIGIELSAPSGTPFIDPPSDGTPSEQHVTFPDTSLYPLTRVM